MIMVKKAERAKRRKRRKMIQRITLLCIGFVIVIFAGVGVAKLTHKVSNYVTTTTECRAKEKEGPKEVSLVMVGDNLLHMPLVRNAETSKGIYNFDSLYEKMGSYFKEADLAVIVQETVLGGKELGYSGYPLFNSPQEVGDSMVNAGFDIILHATNHTLDKGQKGVENTLEYWKTHPDIKVLGINESEEAKNTINYIEKNGIKMAVMNYTDSTNGISVPQNKPYLINTVDRERMARELQEAEQNADISIVFMHWGTEYKLDADESQRDLAKFLCENGADLIMGSHPHVIEPVEWVKSDSGKSALVFYSLGNYVSRQKEATNLLGLLAKVTICSDVDGTRISYASVTPTVTHYNSGSRGFYVYPLKDYTDELASKHGVAQYDGKVSVERFRNTFEKVFAENTAVALDY